MYWHDFVKAIPDHSDNLRIEGRDGIGRKTQAPWVRIYSEDLSPSATTGFYLVIHFTTNGQSFFITLGCGANKWDSERGDLIKYADKDIYDKVNWAKSILNQEGVDYTGFTDQINIGSKHTTPKSFEKATVICKKINVTETTDDEIKKTIVDALRILSVIYSHRIDANSTISSILSGSELDVVINPIKSNNGTGQGFSLSAPERKAVEIRAMEVTLNHLISLGYKVKNTSANNPFDYLAKKAGETIKVEVKGTTSISADAVMMTSNEVELHKNEVGTIALAIVRQIKFTERGVQAKCEGGLLEFIYPWRIEKWTLEPKAYLVRRS